ncbi:Cof-type HAD-IIB family hydrolase [uncultured Thomasclavelia sp.]|uniref:Cof-type HAD-IIB family hydrolase n=1 Tax=uncultured Thomasclavelia sp. TaxID=3025759 RepID=UPI0025FEC9FB|nr:Cof-type HAD-IIB family hydrolase [uncultured Thomasclavelia sp.]
MKTNKILFFDIDGTLLSETTHTVCNSTIEAIKKAKQNNHLIFINTGRPLATIDQKIKDLNPDGYICGCGTYIDFHDQVLFSKTLDKKRCLEIVASLRKNKIDGILEGSKAVYFDHEIKHPVLQEIKEHYQADGCNVLDFDEPDIEFDKFTIWFDDSANLSAFKQEISHDFDYIVRGDDFGEIVPAGFSKATGIQFLLDYFNLDLEDAYVFGDSFNDRTMLEYVKYAIVMGNGNPELFDLAYLVTKSIDDDGIEYAMKQLELI